MSEMCCTWLAEIQDAKNRHFGTMGQLCRAVSAQRRHVSTIAKKTCQMPIPPPHVIMWWTRPTNGWDLLASLGHPCKFQWLSCLGSVTARHYSSGRQPNFAAL